MASPEDDRARSFAPPQRRRRRWSAWTILAPLAAVILWVSFFSALGKSCVFKECSSNKDTGAAAAATGTSNELPRGARAKVKSGDSLGAIAGRYQLSEDELKACNPLVDPQTLQPGTYLVVSAVDCTDADKAETGANPDPLAGDTSTAVPNPANNGTAAADPSATANAPAATTSADKGDEG